MSRLATLHPTVAAVYFLSVLAITMFAADPWFAGLALLGGGLFYINAEGLRRFGRSIGWYLVFFSMVALSNPLFSHKGVTPLFFLNGNPVTLEALLYGVYLGVMLLAALYWFRCLSAVMTEDKWLFLFGRISPKLSLLLSSALRFIPLLKEQAGRIRQAQTAMSLYATDTWTDKLKGTVRVYSALITWALENAIDTGSVMKARGYGLPGRSHYSLYTFRRADAGLLLLIATLDAVVIAAMASDRTAFAFYPALTAAPLSAMSVAAVAAFAALSLLPCILEVKEGLQWTYYRSKI